MEAFIRLEGLAAPLAEANIDTDIIFPARFLLITAKAGLGRYAFHDRRYGPDGAENEGFVLNKASYRSAPILVAADNFGSGSSREQAVWALHDLGVRCVISSRFGEIFRSNCFKNGVLPVSVSPGQLALLMGDAEAGLPLVVDLEQSQVLRRNAEAIGFSIEPWQREAMIRGWDEIALALNGQSAAIAEFEQRQRLESPWLYSGD